MNKTLGMNAGNNPQLNDENTAQAQGKTLNQLGFSDELFEKIFVLADDTNKASKYFQPVIDAAAVLKEKRYSSPTEAAKDIGELMGNIFYYLDNRGASRFSRQRTARRKVCNDVLKGFGSYLYTAEPEFKDAIQQRVCYAKAFEAPESTEKAAVDEFVTSYGETISNESINTEVAKRRFLELPPEAIKKDATNSLAKIRLSLDALSAMMTNKMPPVPKENASAEEKKAYESEIMFVGFGITKLHREIIASCNTYIGQKKIDKRLAAVARDLIAGCEHDSKFFANGISEYLAGHKGQDVVTWGDAIAQKGSEYVQLSDKDVKKIGAGTSVVYRYKKNKENKYFKEEEKVSANLNETTDSFFEKLDKMPGYDESFKDNLSNLKEQLTEQFRNAGFSSYSKPDKALVAQYDLLIKQFFIKKGSRRTFIEMAKTFDEDTLEKNSLLDYLSKLDESKNPEYCKFVNSIISDLLKKFNSDYIAVSTVKIDPGNTLSNRNVATSRMAELMGISNMVMKSETQEVRNGKDKLVGNVMEEAKGRTAAIALNNNKKYSPEGINQIVTMQVFDLICGQLDRNTQNYNVQLKDDCINSIYMIDNDMSFGNLTDIKEGEPTMSMVKSNSIMIEALSPQIKDTIKKLADYSTDALSFVFGDILSKKEIACLKTRITIISDSIKEYEKDIEADSEEKKIAEYMKDPYFRALRYQYRL
ncbi:MAG: hypothetical protein J6N76_02580, partial [Lachnospiraceae bacterium]|nr:hypothetical protein [Lachnospiraceae bacterium]